MMGFHPIDAFFSSYGVSVLKLSEANSGLVLSAAYIAFILAAIPSGVLAGKIGRKRVVMAGLVLFAGALLTAFFTPWVPVMVVLMALGGVGWAMIDINIFAMVLDAAGMAGEEREAGANLGTATGIYFVAATLAATLGPVLNGWLIDLSGHNYSTIFLIGPAFFCLAFACMSQVRHGEAHGSMG
jgi:MFS family permease